MRYLKINCLLVLGALVFSCAKTPNEVTLPEEEFVSYSMEFVGRVDGYDGAIAKTNNPTKADGDDAWKDGDKLSITFYLPNNKTITGAAEYDTETNSWSVAAYGSLIVGDNMKCELSYSFYVEDVLIDRYRSSVAYFEDSDARYSVNSDKQLTVYATLKPKTPRIRFTGALPNRPEYTYSDPNYSETIYILGIKTYPNNSPNSIITVNLKDGTTPYIYGDFVGDETRIYMKYYDNNYGDRYFTRIFNSSKLKKGESGYMAVPTLNSHKNWICALNIMVDGVEFNMLPARGGGFLGETEVTEELYQTVNGNPSNSQLPQTNITREEAREFAMKLSTKTPFDISIMESNGHWTENAGAFHYHPYNGMGAETEADTDYYKDVAWTSENTSTLQPVKQKAPNEYGFYDMYGNAAEWIYYSYWFDPFYSMGYNNFYYNLGFSYQNSVRDFRAGWEWMVGFTLDPDYKSETIGFRLYSSNPF